MTRIAEIITYTPLWVWPLFLLLIALGVRSSRTRVVRLRTLYIVPCIYLLLSLRTMFLQNVSFTIIDGWALGVLLGSAIGWFICRNRQVRFDRTNRLIELPGEWLTLIMIVTYFIIRDYYNYEFLLTPSLGHDIEFLLVYYIITGAFTGFFLGRTVLYIRRYKKGPSISLKN